VADEKAEKAEKAGKSKKDVKVYKPGRSCPKCGSRMAEHSDRFTCGKCGYTEFKKQGK
jgi:small subunit ribosomal protein S27Ae